MSDWFKKKKTFDVVAAELDLMNRLDKIGEKAVKLKAERDRLRAALTKIVQHLDSANGLSTDMSILSIAREALGEK